MNGLRGSCLCGGVRFEVEGPIRGVGQCHCSLCRKVSGTMGNAIFLVPKERFRWIEGEDAVRTFSLPSGWGVTRCVECGSPLPVCLDENQYWVNAGLMDDPIRTTIKIHIHTASMADWDRIPESERQFAGWPPGHPLAK
jgi:hypothetical protein